MTNILILGGGFAAVAAAQELVRAKLDDTQITMIAASSNFTFYPALVPYVFDDLSITREDITFDLAVKAAENKIRFIRSEVLSVDPSNRTVTVAGEDVEGVVHYDRLIIALGHRLATETVPGFFEYSQHLLSIDAAERFKDSINRFECGDIVVGLVPNAFLPVPVCETALALSEKFKEKIGSGNITVTAVFPETIDDAFLGSSLFRDIRSALQTRGVKIFERFPIAEIESNHLTAASGETINYDLLMLVPAFRGQTSLNHLGTSYDPRGFVTVDEFMAVQGSEHIFAAGDIVSIPGPRFGYMAIRQGKAAASNVIASIDPTHERVKYRHDLVWTIGEKYTHPIYFHYGFWDESLDDFDENLFFGAAKVLREKYGPITGYGKPLEAVS